MTVPRRVGNIQGHGESFNGRVLREYLEKKQSAKLLRQNGTSHSQYLLPSGRVAKCAPDSDPVSKAMMRWNAEALGMSYGELRADMGIPVPNRGKSRFKPAPPPEKVIGRMTVIHKLNDIIAEAERLKGMLMERDRDPAVVRRVYEAACGAEREINHYRATEQIIRAQM